MKIPNKLILVLLFTIAHYFNFISAQNTEDENPALDSATVIAYWAKNEDGMYRFSESRNKYLDSVLVDSFENIYLGVIKITDSTDKKYVLEAQLKDDPFFEKPKNWKQYENDFASIICGKLLIAKIITSAEGEAQEIENFEELKNQVATFTALVEEIVLKEVIKDKAISEDDKKAIIAKTKDLLLGDNFIKEKLFGGVIDLLKYHGKRYPLDSVFVYTDTVEYSVPIALNENVNLNFVWNCESYYTLDSNNVLKIEQIRELDTENYAHTFANKMDELGHLKKNNEKVEDVIAEISQNLERQISYTYYIDVDSGWTLYFENKDYSRNKNTITVKTKTADLLTDEERKEIENKK